MGSPWDLGDTSDPSFTLTSSHAHGWWSFPKYLADMHLGNLLLFLTHWETKRLELVVSKVLVVLRLYHPLDKSFFHFLLIVHVEFVVPRPQPKEESIRYALGYALCRLHFLLSWNSYHLARVWLSSFVCSFLIELCGLCSLSWCLFTMYWTWISPSISVGDFTSGTFWLELFVMLWTRCIVLHSIVEDWLCVKPFQLDKWIFNSLLIVTYSGRTISTLDGHNLYLFAIVLFAYCTDNFQWTTLAQLLDFGLQTLLALDKSILTIANYSRNWKLGSLIGA